jgi:hypothetical protein
MSMFNNRWLLLAVVSMGSGCAGRATVHLVPLGAKRMTVGEPLVTRIKPQECYYWTNEAGKLCIAMREFRPSILGRALGREFVASLVFDAPPSGPAAGFDADRETSRSVMDAGFLHTRAVSLSGVAAIWDYGERTLQGRFRIVTNQQSFLVLTRWGSDQRVLFVGEFRAVRDREEGERLLDRTERGEMGRFTAPG